MFAELRNRLHESLRTVFGCDDAANLLLITVGYACLIGWFSNLYGGIGPTPTSPIPKSFLLYYGSLYAGVGIFAGLVMFIFAAFPKPVERFLQWKQSNVITALITAVSTLALAAIPDQIPGSGTVFLVLSTLGSAAWTLLLLEYNRMLYCYPLQSIGALTSIALLGNILFSLVLTPISPTANTLLMAAGPLVAAFILSRMKLKHDTVEAPPSSPSPKQILCRRKLYALAFCVMTWQIVNKVAQTVSAYPNSEAMPLPLLSSMQPWTIGFILAAMVPMVLYYLWHPRRFKFSHVYRVYFLLSLVGVIGLEFTTQLPLASVLYSLNGATFQVANLAFWPIALYASHQLGEPVRILAIVNGMWTIGPALGMAAGTILGATGLATSEAVIVITAFAILAMVFTYTCVFPERDADLLADSLPPRRRMFRERCNAVAERFNLTPREREVMLLIACGKDMPAMQEALVLSKSTISTHREHLYRKMGIHSRQSLINMIDEEP